jgi:hypothetical protein
MCGSKAAPIQNRKPQETRTVSAEVNNRPEPPEASRVPLSAPLRQAPPVVSARWYQPISQHSADTTG